jgi:translation initiation factor IF-1
MVVKGNRRPPQRRKRKKSFEKKEDKIYFEGVVTQTLPGTRFEVKIDRGSDLEPWVLNTQAKAFFMKKKIKILKGDKVMVELDPIDLSKGTIVNIIRDFNR